MVLSKSFKDAFMIFHSFIFSTHFILVILWWNTESIPEKQGCYTLDGITGHCSAPGTHTFANPPTRGVFRKFIQMQGGQANVSTNNNLSSGSNLGPWACEAALFNILPSDLNTMNFKKYRSNTGIAPDADLLFYLPTMRRSVSGSCLKSFLKSSLRCLYVGLKT